MPWDDINDPDHDTLWNKLLEDYNGKEGSTTMVLEVGCVRYISG
jgi:hypothetical protein